MTFTFKDAADFKDRIGLFVALTGGTNSGKTFSALRLGRGIAGPTGKLAVLDTEGGRTLHLKDQFRFDVSLMEPPFRPERFSEAAIAAEAAGYDVLVIDSFSMEWAGMGGVLDWQEHELQRIAGDDFRKRERAKMAAFIKPKMAHKSMVYSLLQRRMPIIFSIRGEESVKPGEAGEKPQKLFKSITNQLFPFEVTVSFRLAQDRKGIVDLSDPRSFKMEGTHRSIFLDGDLIAEEHGAALAEWARGGASRPVAAKSMSIDALKADGEREAHAGMGSLGSWWQQTLTGDERKTLGAAELDRLKRLASEKSVNTPAGPAETAGASKPAETDTAPVQSSAGNDTTERDWGSEESMRWAHAEGIEWRTAGKARRGLPEDYSMDGAEREASAWYSGYDGEAF